MIDNTYSPGRILEEIHWLCQYLLGYENQEAAEFALDCYHGNCHDLMIATMRHFLNTRFSYGY